MKVRALALIIVAATGCSAGKDDDTVLTLPRFYPPVRATTPTALIADPTFTATAALTSVQAQMGDTMPGNMNPMNPSPGAISLGLAVQQRFYSPGPTSLLRIVSDLDGRVASLDPRPSKHPCLTSEPVSKTYAMPGGQTFTLKLQCLQNYGSDWVAFGFGTALQGVDAGASDDDAGPPDGGALGAEGGGDDFYLVQGQTSGNGGVYHLSRASGNVEAWIAVADKIATGNSQVMMHLLTNKVAGTLELTLGGAAVGFCSAHLQTGGGFLYIMGKSNGEGATCSPTRAGCFAPTDLATDLGASAASCAGIAASTFRIATALDASSDAGANITPATIHTYFSQPPTGVPAF